jgi:hypothetical protein
MHVTQMDIRLRGARLACCEERMPLPGYCPVTRKPHDFPDVGNTDKNKLRSL